jgi:outer membrane protein assembly factor BamE (lipoprotein component of BamABCDE complex)
MLQLSSRKLSAVLVFGFVLTLASGEMLCAAIPHEPQAPQAAVNTNPGGKDRTQWRQLKRKMSKDEVKKLLGGPMRVSVSKYYESWDYAGGTVTFDAKGHVDFWYEA